MKLLENDNNWSLQKMYEYLWYKVRTAGDFDDGGNNVVGSYYFNVQGNSYETPLIIEVSPTYSYGEAAVYVRSYKYTEHSFKIPMLFDIVTNPDERYFRVEWDFQQEYTYFRIYFTKTFFEVDWGGQDYLETQLVLKQKESGKILSIGLILCKVRKDIKEGFDYKYIKGLDIDTDIKIPNDAARVKYFTCKNSNASYLFSSYREPEKFSDKILWASRRFYTIEGSVVEYHDTVGVLSNHKILPLFENRTAVGTRKDTDNIFMKAKDSDQMYIFKETAEFPVIYRSGKVVSFTQYRGIKSQHEASQNDTGWENTDMNSYYDTYPESSKNYSLSLVIGNDGFLYGFSISNNTLYPIYDSNVSNQIEADYVFIDAYYNVVFGKYGKDYYYAVLNNWFKGVDVGEDIEFYKMTYQQSVATEGAVTKVFFTGFYHNRFCYNTVKGAYIDRIKEKNGSFEYNRYSAKNTLGDGCFFTGSVNDQNINHTKGILSFANMWDDVSGNPFLDNVPNVNIDLTKTLSQVSEYLPEIWSGTIVKNSLVPGSYVWYNMAYVSNKGQEFPPAVLYPSITAIPDFNSYNWVYAFGLGYSTYSTVYLIADDGTVLMLQGKVEE